VAAEEEGAVSWGEKDPKSPGDGEDEFQGITTRGHKGMAVKHRDTCRHKPAVSHAFSKCIESTKRKVFIMQKGIFQNHIFNNWI